MTNINWVMPVAYEQVQVQAFGTYRIEAWAWMSIERISGRNPRPHEELHNCDRIKQKEMEADL